MPKYTIEMPFTGIAFTVIEAETKDEALTKFHEEATFPSLKKTCETDVEIEEWNFCEQIVEGNIFHGVRNDMDITED